MKTCSKNTAHLDSSHFDIPDLKAGAEVTVKAADIFDTIHRFPDGRSEGNETGKLIQNYSQ